MNKILLYLRHGWQLISEDRLFSGIYVAGTAVAVGSAMVIALLYNVMLANIYPETHRDRTLYVEGYLRDSLDQGRLWPFYSIKAIDECFSKLESAEAVSGSTQLSATDMIASYGAGERELQMTSMYVTPGFFRLYEFNFLAGRPISENEYRHAERVCVVTNAFKVEVGESLLLNGIPYRVVGVVRAAFGLMRHSAADVYLPASLQGKDMSPSARSDYDGWLNVRVLLKEGYTREQFLSEWREAAARYCQTMNQQSDDYRLEWVIRADSQFFRIFSFFDSPDETASDRVRNVVPIVVIMLLLLLLPAINLGGLVSNRMEARLAEMGVRKAFGARRSTLLAEVLTENLVLTCVGGLVGYALSVGVFMMLSQLPFIQMAFGYSSMSSVSFDLNMFLTPAVFLVAFACCVVLNLMAALVPAWHSLRRPIVESLNQKK